MNGKGPLEVFLELLITLVVAGAYILSLIIFAIICLIAGLFVICIGAPIIIWEEITSWLERRKK